MACCNVLVVDDDPDVLEGVSALLHSEGHGVRLAGGGVHALQQLRDQPRPTMVLLDLAMPDVDGWRVVTELRQRPELAELPVYAFTGSTRPPPAELATRVLQKPVPVDELLRVVGSHCPGAARARG